MNPAIQSLDPARFTQRDKYLLDRAIALQSGGGGGGGSCDCTDVIRIGDDAGGDLAGQYPNPVLAEPIRWQIYQRAHRFFHVGSGPVFTGLPNNTRWRLRVNDDDLGMVYYYLEPADALTASDLVLPSGSAGVVLYGRVRGGLYRLGVTDDDMTAPLLTVSELASPLSVAFGSDYWFEPGASFSVRGALTDPAPARLWTVYIDDSERDPMIALERFSP